MELSAQPIISPLSEESYMRMGFEDNVGDDQIDFGKNTVDRNNWDGEEDLRDGNNNSSLRLFTETEIVGRGRGLLAKVKPIITIMAFIVIIAIIFLIMIIIAIFMITMSSRPR